MFCLFNQEAAASAPVGIHKYSNDLTELLLPPETGKNYTDLLADRLFTAEERARTGKGGLIPEAQVVLAFNQMMEAVGAPSWLRANKQSLRKFREHAASLNEFPALFSAERNGTSCNPGEAVFLLYLLISNNGVLSNQELDFAQSLMQMNNRPTERRYAISGMESGLSATGFVSSYADRHGRNAAITLFNRTANMLGF